MARLEDLIDQIGDASLRLGIEQEVRELKRRHRFGIVFERHIPEVVALLDYPVEAGSLVRMRTDPQSPIYRAISVEGKSASIEDSEGLPFESAVSVKDLQVVRRLDEPVYPALEAVGESRGTEPSNPHHIVINGENFHALQLLKVGYERKVDCIYIDPPYNTGARDWKYNNAFVDKLDTYRHSKWLSMIEKRLRLAKQLLKEDGVLVVTIDENEHAHLVMLLEEVFRGYEHHSVAIVHNPRGVQGDNFSYTNEFAVFVIPAKQKLIVERELDADEKAANTSNFRNWGGESERSDAKNCFYPVYVKDGVIVGFGDVASDDYHPKARAEEIDGETVAIWPIDNKGVERKWRYARQSVEAIQHLLVVKEGRNDLEVYIAKSAGKYKTVWTSPKYDSGTHGSPLIRKFAGAEFSYPKSLYAVYEVLYAVTANRPDAVILDFFAGSGTTLHATCLLNTIDQGSRQCILVTNNEVEDSVAKKLVKGGHYPGDASYEQHGIFEAVTRPRCESVISGNSPAGEPIEGSYDMGDKRPFKQGFEENVAFFRLKYLDPDLVELGSCFQDLQSLLWLIAGAQGVIPNGVEDAPYVVCPDAGLAVLRDEAHARRLAADLDDAPSVRHVFIETESPEAYADIRQLFPARETHMLYRDYLQSVGRKLL